MNEYDNSPHPLIRVLLADDHPGTRAGLRRMLNRTGHISVAGEAKDGREALDLVQRVSADVLLLDMDMPTMGGLEVMKHLQAVRACIQVLGFSNYSDQYTVFKLLALGAAGYLSKEDARDEILQAIDRAAAGEKGQLSQAVRSVLAGVYVSASAGYALDRFPEKTLQVARAVALGYHDWQIAETYQYAMADVQHMVRSLQNALALRSREALVRWGWEAGLSM